MEAEQLEFAGVVKNLPGPAVKRRGGPDVVQHGMDIDGFAQVTAEIFAKPLHIKNFPQKARERKEVFVMTGMKQSLTVDLPVIKRRSH
jgi:hypothetical protein